MSAGANIRTDTISGNRKQARVIMPEYVKRRLGKIWRGFRTFILLCMVVYSIAICISLFDAISFQERVLRTVGGEDRDLARAVIIRLEQIGEQNDGLPSRLEQELPVGALALGLDEVRILTESLARFENVTFTAGADGEAQDASQSGESDNAPAEPVTIRDLVPAFRDRLDVAFRELNNRVEQAFPGVAMLRSLDEFERYADNIKEFKVPPNSDPEDITKLGKFSIDATDLKNAFVQLESRITQDQAYGENIKQLLDAAKQETDELENLATGNLAILINAPEAVGNHADSLRELIDDLKTGVEKAQPSALKTEIENLNRAYDDVFNKNMILPPKDLKKPEMNNEEYKKAISVFNDQIGKIRTSTRTAMPGFEQAETIMSALARMKDVVNNITALPFERANIRLRGGENVNQGLRPDELFSEQLNKLGDAVAMMTNALAKDSRIGQIAGLLRDEPRSNFKADLLLTDFRQLDSRWSSYAWTSWLPFPPRSLAVSSRETLDIMLVMIVGAIGSIIYMIQRNLRLLIHGQSNAGGTQATEAPTNMPFGWYVFRPVFGAVVAFSVYLLYKTGQVALGSEGLAEALRSGVNIPILAVLGLFSGLMSWQVLQAIQSKGEAWLVEVHRRDLWATGLKQALDIKGTTEEDCARQIGRSITQIDRWLMLKDPVIPEMQDRLVGWLGVSRGDLFSSLGPGTEHRGPKRNATGLKPYLQRIGSRHNVTSIARSLGVSEKTVEDWRDLRNPVDSDHQWALVELLDERFNRFYKATTQHSPLWAHGLRKAMRGSNYPDAASLAARLDVDESVVRAWRELDEPIPELVAETLADDLQTTISGLCGLDEDRSSMKFFALPGPLAEALTERYQHAGNNVASLAADADVSARHHRQQLAHDLDVKPATVDAWVSGDKPVYKPTCTEIIRILGTNRAMDDLFESAA
ncbi:MAG: hypothetical protein R3C70_16460 [Geminicoccaceae bacterium]